ncbi:MAG: hypothetical protein OEW75_18060, partial [Cyclobacteriaceae bacterium]|nr:hypothetical protein [Cyclobacteriaceae bacterium]
MRYFLIFILLLVFSGNFAQQVSYSPMEISLPPSVRITSIAHDNLGMIWVGTSKGLFSYDGEELIKHSEIVNEQPVLGFAESDEGKLLAFGKFGILQIHNQGNSVEIFSV